MYMKFRIRKEETAKHLDLDAETWNPIHFFHQGYRETQQANKLHGLLQNDFLGWEALFRGGSIQSRLYSGLQNEPSLEMHLQRLLLYIFSSLYKCLYL